MLAACDFLRVFNRVLTVAVHYSKGLYIVVRAECIHNISTIEVRKHYEKHFFKQENVSQYGRAMGVSAGYSGHGLEDYIVFHRQKTRLQISVSGADSIV